MINGDVNTAGGGKALWFGAGALVVAAAIALFLYADGYFDRSNSVEFKIEIPKVELQGN